VLPRISSAPLMPSFKLLGSSELPLFQRWLIGSRCSASLVSFSWVSAVSVMALEFYTWDGCLSLGVIVLYAD